ncbi:peptide deformylase [Corynebacterium doosanense]|uniref:Peptide deformylase n=1 Tax=Corynebacterium doosanense CAU 212 = DSM 45436 TaxID=558173 RepID=A0A097IG94_9CORY|nr:peptide deformylase [Corynebacterium doosanense]AIT61155.1 peptide deformylase [Corynebacterium doosanense CAU 212 = DSM 45436]
MTVRPIRMYGDPVLKTRASEVTEFGTPGLRAQVTDMLETMDSAGGVGLASNQIGLLNRVIVFDTSHQPGGLRGHLINPSWVPIGDQTQIGKEGCLSIPGISMDTERHMQVLVRGRDVDGRPVAIQASRLLARCFQHEIDHLDGILFLKRLSPELRREANAILNEERP